MNLVVQVQTSTVIAKFWVVIKKRFIFWWIVFSQCLNQSHINRLTLYLSFWYDLKLSEWVLPPWTFFPWLTSKYITEKSVATLHSFELELPRKLLPNLPLLLYFCALLCLAAFVFLLSILLVLHYWSVRFPTITFDTLSTQLWCQLCSEVPHLRVRPYLNLSFILHQALSSKVAFTR